MAWQYVGGTTGTGSGATSYTVSLAGTLTGGLASSPAPGDLVVVMHAFAHTASVAPTCSGDVSGAYAGVGTAIHANDTWDTEVRPFYAVMGSTPDSTLTVNRINNTTYGAATVVQVWRGVDAADPFIGSTQASGTNSCVVNPPAHNPAVEGAMIFAGGAGTMAATSTDFTGFTGMSNFLTRKGDGSTSDCATALATYEYAGSSYDPPSISGGTTSTSSSWGGYTFSFRPAPPPEVDLTGESSRSDHTSTTGSVTQTHALTGANSTQAATATAGAVVQTHLLAGNSVAQATTSTTGAVDSQAPAVVLTGANARQDTTIITGAVQQTHALAGAAVAQPTTSTAQAVSQAHQLAGGNAAVAHTATAAAVAQVHTLAGASAQAASTASAGAVAQTHVLAGQSAQQITTSTAGPVSETATTTLQGAHAAQPNTATTGAVQQLHQLDGSVCQQPNSTTAGSVGQAHVLVAAPVAVDAEATASAVVQMHLLAGADAVAHHAATAGAVYRLSASRSTEVGVVLPNLVSGVVAAAGTAAPATVNPLRGVSPSISNTGRVTWP